MVSYLFVFQSSFDEKSLKHKFWFKCSSPNSDISGLVKNIVCVVDILEEDL